MGRSFCGTCMLVTATILGPIVMVLMAVSFATDYWLKFDVDRTKISGAIRLESETDYPTARYTHDRHRGLFRECYPGNETKFLDQTPPDGVEIIDKHCFWTKYDIPENTNYDWSSEYESRIHLMRCWLAFFIIALVVFLVAYIFGLVLCCWRQSRWAYIAGLCAYIAAFSTAGSIAFFHGAEYLERNKILDIDPYMGKFYLNWDSSIANNTERTYGYSYIIGWVAMGLAALTATFYSIAGCYIGGERYEDKEYLEKSRGREYVDRAYPMPLEPPHPEHYYGYPRGPAYQGPYLYDMENRQPLPAIGYAPQEVQQAPAQWRWQ